MRSSAMTRDRLAERPVALKEARRAGHDVADPVPVGVGVDAGDRLALPLAAGAAASTAAASVAGSRGRLRIARSASAQVRMPRVRKCGSSARKICAAVRASPKALWRSSGSTPSHAPSVSSVKSGSAGAADFGEQPRAQVRRRKRLLLQPARLRGEHRHVDSRPHAR